MDVEQISAYFQQHQFNGARKLFTAIITGKQAPNYAMIRFYEPISGSLSTINADEFSAAHGRWPVGSR